MAVDCRQWRIRFHCLAASPRQELQVIVHKGFFLRLGLGTRLDTYSGMKFDDRRLVRHLAIAVALKLVVLCVLWWAFVRDVRVNTDAEQTAEHIGVEMAPQGAPSDFRTTRRSVAAAVRRHGACTTSCSCR